MGFLFTEPNIFKKRESTMFWMMFYDRFLVSYDSFDWGCPCVFTNDATLQLLDTLASTPFETCEQYWKFCLVSC